MNEKQAKTSKLTTKQKKLVVELANPKTKSIAEAGRNAGFAEASVRSTVYGLLNDPFISEQVQKRRQRALAHHQVMPEEVIGSAVFQMRSSMRDVLDDDGSYSFDKACETGAIDLLKKHKETFREIKDNKGITIETVKTVEVELLSNQDGRKEVANYIGVENMPNPHPSPTDQAIQAFHYLLEMFKGKKTEAQVIEAVLNEFPDVTKEVLLLGEGKV